MTSPWWNSFSADTASKKAGTAPLRPAKSAVLHGLFESVHLSDSRSQPAASVAQLAEQLICNQQVAGSTPAASSAHSPASSSAMSRKQKPEHTSTFKLPIASHSTHHTFTFTKKPRKKRGSFPSGQRGQTVNLMAYVFAGSNPALPSLASAACLGSLTGQPSPRFGCLVWPCRLGWLDAGVAQW